MRKNKNMQLLALILGIIGLFMIFTGSSYAFFSSSVTSKDYVMTTGNLQLNFSKKSNEINLTNTYPLSNNDGLATEGYSFDITNNGSISTKYQLRLELDPNNTIPIEYIRLSYVKTKENGVNTNNSLSEPVLLSDLNAIYSFVKDEVIEPSNTDSYTLKLWIDFSAPNDIQGKTFKAKIVIDSLQNVEDGYVFNSTRPIITLNKFSDGNTDISLVKGDSFTDPGVLSIKDDKDLLTVDDISITYEYTSDGVNLETVNSIDTNSVGVYYIKYQVTDSSNNIGSSIRVVTVNNTKTKPDISLNGDNPMYISQFESYVEPGAISNAKVAIIGNIDNTKVDNINMIRYIAVDNYGNVNSLVRTVIVKKPDFSTDSWETIVANIRAGNGDVYAPVEGGRSEQSLKEIELTNKRDETEKHYLRVANTTPCTNGETSETACGFVVEFASIVEGNVMMPDNTDKFGYADSNIIKSLNDLYNSLDNSFKQYIIDTTVVANHSDDDNKNPNQDYVTDFYERNIRTDSKGNYIIDNQKLYLLDLQEVFGNNDSSNSSASTTRQLDYYRINSDSDSKIKYYAESSSNDINLGNEWWLRTVLNHDSSSSLNYFNIIDNNGILSSKYVIHGYGVSPAFRIG